MNVHEEARRRTLEHTTRRHFLRSASNGLGGVVLASMFGCRATSVDAPRSPMLRDLAEPLAQRAPHFAPKAKRVIFLHMAGAPSQHELFDYKPELARLDGQP